MKDVFEFIANIAALTNKQSILVRRRLLLYFLEEQKIQKITQKQKFEQQDFTKHISLKIAIPFSKLNSGLISIA